MVCGCVCGKSEKTSNMLEDEKKDTIMERIVHQDEDFVPGARPVRISMSWKAFGRSIAKREENDQRRHSVYIFVVSEWTQAKTAVPPFLFLFRTANPKDEFNDMTKFGNRDGSVQCESFSWLPAYAMIRQTGFLDSARSSTFVKIY